VPTLDVYQSIHTENGPGSVNPERVVDSPRSEGDAVGCVPNPDRAEQIDLTTSTGTGDLGVCGGSMAVDANETTTR